MRSKVISSFCLVLLLFLMYHTFNEVFLKNEDDPVKKKMFEEVKIAMRDAFEVLKNYTSEELQRSFVETLGNLTEFSVALCDRWNKSPFIEFEDCKKIDACQIPKNIKYVQEELSLKDASLNSVTKVFGNQFHKTSYKIFEDLFYNDNSRTIAPRIRNFTLKIEASDSEFAINVKSIVNGLVQCDRLIQSCIFDLKKFARTVKTCGSPMSHSELSFLTHPYSGLKGIVVSLSYHLSVEVAKREKHLIQARHEIGDFKNDMKNLQIILTNTTEMWKRNDFNSKYFACKPFSVIPQDLDILIEKLLFEAGDPKRFLDLKDAFKPSCEYQAQDNIPTLVVTNTQNRGLNIFKDLVKLLLDVYPKNAHKCLTMIRNGNNCNHSFAHQLSEKKDIETFKQWFSQTLKTLCKQPEDDLSMETFQAFEEDYDKKENNLNFSLILVKCQVMIMLVFRLCPKIPFGLYVLVLTFSQNMKHLIKKRCACHFKRLVIEIYNASETPDIPKFNYKKRRKKTLKKMSKQK